MSFDRIAGRLALTKRKQLHPYEGHKLSTVIYPIRVMARLGIRNLISKQYDCSCIHAY